MDSYTQKLFSKGLGVEEPWYIRDLDFIEVGEKAGSRHGPMGMPAAGEARVRE